MSNTITIAGSTCEVSEEQRRRIEEILREQPVELGTLSPGKTFRMAGYELFVLAQDAGLTVSIFKELYRDEVEFGENNNYDGSNVDKICNKLAAELEAAAGEGNLVEHVVDLTADDGLKDYGEIVRKVSVMTADRQRRYVEVLDLHPVGEWHWLATPHSTPRYEGDSWVKCVAPSGRILFRVNYVNCGGVRPFCVFKSSIFVSR